MTTPKDDRGISEVETVGEVLSSVATHLAEALRQMERSLGPVLRRLGEWSEAAAPYLKAFYEWSEGAAPYLKAFYEWSRSVDALKQVGWLPYHSAPFHYVEECGDDLALLDSRFSDYYRTQWHDIRRDITSRIADYNIDDEARATFREAMSAHESRHYRCVCRVLFPEIERMIGAGRVGSKQMLEELTESRDPADLLLRERFSYVLFGYLVKHCYEQVGEEERAKFECDPVPNRHAAMHALVPYSTHKNSMNMLILTDYVFSILPPLEDGSASP